MSIHKPNVMKSYRPRFSGADGQQKIATNHRRPYPVWLSLSREYFTTLHSNGFLRIIITRLFRGGVIHTENKTEVWLKRARSGGWVDQ